jgi:thiamine pyrophosphate-dependent acetolactate synthase large subunit-like protein
LAGRRIGGTEAPHEPSGARQEAAGCGDEHGDRWMGGIGMIGTKANYHAVMNCDLFLMLGTDYPYSEFLPRKCVVIQVDERARVIGRRAPTELGVIGSVRPTVKSLLARVKPKSGSRFFETIATQRKSWNEMQDKQSDTARSRDRIHPQAVARMVTGARLRGRGLQGRKARRAARGHRPGAQGRRPGDCRLRGSG